MNLANEDGLEPAKHKYQQKMIFVNANLEFTARMIKPVAFSRTVQNWA